MFLNYLRKTKEKNKQTYLNKIYSDFRQANTSIKYEWYILPNT